MAPLATRPNLRIWRLPVTRFNAALEGARMQALLDDMISFNRTRLGLGITIAPTNIDLSRLAADVLDQLRAVHPDRQVDLDVVGDCTGVWDGPCLQQLLGNLVLNAIKYGAQDAPVSETLTGRDAGVLLKVSNAGTVTFWLTFHKIEKISDSVTVTPIGE